MFKNSLIQSAVFGILILLGSCTPRETTKNTTDLQSIQNQSVSVTRGEIVVEVEVPITTTPLTEAILRSPAKGTLVKVPIVGQKVKAGEVVAQLDTDALERAIVKAKIDVAEAQINLEKQTQTLEVLKKTYSSNQSLAEAQLITQDSLLSTKATLKKEELQFQSLELSLKRAQLNLDEAKDNKDEAQIRSPINGVIASVSEGAGTYVEDNTKICTVVDISAVTLTGQVDEYDISQLKPGQKAVAVFEALEGQEFESILKTVSPTAQTENNVPVYSVTTHVSNQEQIIRPGMSGDLTVTVVRKSGLVIPLKAVTSVRNRSYVEIFQEGTKSLVLVELGEDDGKQVLVVSGLEEGQLLAYTLEVTTTTTKAASKTTTSSNQTSLLGMTGPGAGGPPPGGF